MNNSLKSISAVSQDETGRINLKRMIRLRLPLIVGVFVALAVPGSIAVWKMVPLTYKASAEVRFLALTPRVMGHDNRENTMPYEKFLNTQLSLITGNAVLSQVLAEPEVQSLPLISDQPVPLEFLKAVIKAEPQPNSELVTISCKLPDRDTAKLLVDKTLAAYMKYALAEDIDTGRERLTVLMKERDIRQTDLDNQLAKINELQHQLGASVTGSSKDGFEKATAYEETHARAQEDVSKAGSKMKLLTEQMSQINDLSAKYKASPGKPIFEMGIEDKVALDPRVIAARQEFIKLDAGFAEITERYGEKSPQLEVERGKINALKSKVTQTEQSVRGEMIASVRALLEKDLGAMRAETEDAQSRKTGFESLIAEDRKRSAEAAQMAAAIDELKTHADETRSLLRAVREEISSITLESNAPARVKMASAPSVPLTPGFGRRLQVMFLMLMMCGAAGLGAGFLREITDQQIRSEEDLMYVTDSPVLALTPHMDKNAADKYGMVTVAADKAGTAAGNEFRKILSCMVTPRGRSFSHATINSCLVTSPTWGDGKTTVACNLAIALAQADRRVLLMEVSSQRNLERALGMEPARGVTDVLSGKQILRVAARATAHSGLFVLGAGLEPERLSAKVASSEMAALVEKAMRDFDHVIIDTPPFLSVADARLLSLMVDGVVLVAGVGVSTQAMVRQTSDELRRAGARMVGVVLNCARSTREPHLAGVALYEDPFAGQDRRIPGQDRRSPGQDRRNRKQDTTVAIAPQYLRVVEKERVSVGAAVGGADIPKTGNSKLYIEVPYIHGGA